MRVPSLLLFCLLLGCVSDTGNTGGPGEEGKPCFPNKTCNAGLSCVSDVCVRLPGADGGGGGQDGCATMCKGSCVDLSTDPKHCGRCDHDCLGGACDNGRCQPRSLVTMAGLRALAVDSSSLYVADSSTIFRSPKSSGALTPIATNQRFPTKIVAKEASSGSAKGSPCRWGRTTAGA